MLYVSTRGHADRKHFCEILLEGLAPYAADPAAAIVSLHLYTFNAVAATEAWRHDFLSKLPVAQTA